VISKDLGVRSCQLNRGDTKFLRIYFVEVLARAFIPAYIGALKLSMQQSNL